MGHQFLWWSGFLAFVLALLALDLGVFSRRSHEVKLPEALRTTAVWLTLALLFDLGIYLGSIGSYPTAPERHEASLQFLTGYLTELSLSADNVFVFALIFRYFGVLPKYRHRVLFWGILGALILRGAMIFAGVTLLHRLHWVIYLFGALLIYGGWKMWRSSGVQLDPENEPILRLTRRVFRVSRESAGPAFLVREEGRLAATPLLVVLILLEWTDLVFALDSIPAVLAVTSDSFIVFTSNVLAILGLRSLYFALAGVMARFHLLHYGLSAILIMIGAKMLLSEVYPVPTLYALLAVVLILAVSIVASLLRPPAPQVEKAAP